MIDLARDRILYERTYMKNWYNEYAYTKMPFGKHKGKFIKNIPDEYIEWAINNLTDQATATMMAVEWQRRYPKYRKSKS